MQNWRLHLIEICCLKTAETVGNDSNGRKTEQSCRPNTMIVLALRVLTIKSLEALMSTIKIGFQKSF